MSSPDVQPGEDTGVSFWSAVGILLIGVMGIGFAPIFARMAGWYEVGPTASAFWRFVLSLPLLWAAAVYFRMKGGQPGGRDATPASPSDYLLVAAPGMFLGLDMACWHTSFLHTPVANATVIANLATLFVAFAGWFFLKERLKWLYPVGVIAALFGVAILVNAQFDSRSTPYGNFMALAAAMFYCGYQLCAKVARGRFAARTILTYASIAGGLLLLPLPLLFGEHYLPNEPIGWLPLLGLAVFPHVLGQGLIATSLRHLPVSIASPLLLAQPIFVAVFGYVFLGEVVEPHQIVGGLIVLFGLAVAVRGRG